MLTTGLDDFTCVVDHTCVIDLTGLAVVVATAVVDAAALREGKSPRQRWRFGVGATVSSAAFGAHWNPKQLSAHYTSKMFMHWLAKTWKCLYNRQSDLEFQISDFRQYFVCVSAVCTLGLDGAAPIRCAAALVATYVDNCRRLDNLLQSCFVVDYAMLQHGCLLLEFTESFSNIPQRWWEHRRASNRSIPRPANNRSAYVCAVKIFNYICSRCWGS